jgi:nitroreductase
MSHPEVLTAIMNRRAIRHYAGARVSADQVKTLLGAAVHAPTAMHMEPWAFVIVQEPSALKRLSDTAKKLMLAQPLGDDHRLLHHRDVSSQKLRTMLSDQTFNIFYDATTLIVVCGKPLGSYVIADCWLAAQNLMLAAYALGLGTCPIGFAVPALNDSAIKKELSIPPEVTAVAPIIVGVPRGAISPVPRKDPEILSWC